MFTVQAKNIEQHLKEFLLVSYLQSRLINTMVHCLRSTDLRNSFTENTDDPGRIREKPYMQHTRGKWFSQAHESDSISAKELFLKTLPTFASVEVESSSVKNKTKKKTLQLFDLLNVVLLYRWPPMLCFSWDKTRREWTLKTESPSTCSCTW